MSRSYWIDAEGIVDRVVVLTEDAVHTANPKKERLEAIRTALEAGQPIANAIKDEVGSIPLHAITRVVYDRTGDDIEISHRAGKQTKGETVFFASSDLRDDFAQQLAERLTDFTSETKVYGPVRAAVGPIAFGAAVGFFTWVFHGLAVALAHGTEVSTSGRRAGLKTLLVGALDLIGPLGVLIAGGLVLSLTAATLVMRIKEPPIVVTLKPAER